MDRAYILFVNLEHMLEKQNILGTCLKEVWILARAIKKNVAHMHLTQTNIMHE